MFNSRLFMGTKCPLSTEIGYLVHHLSKKINAPFMARLFYDLRRSFLFLLLLTFDKYPSMSKFFALSAYSFSRSALYARYFSQTVWQLGERLGQSLSQGDFIFPQAPIGHWPKTRRHQKHMRKHL